jgi:hypothetical protein
MCRSIHDTGQTQDYFLIYLRLLLQGSDACHDPFCEQIELVESFSRALQSN